MAGDIDELVRVHDVDFWLSEPFDVFRRLRTEAPVYFHPRDELWIISTYEDVRLISTNPRVFSSEYGLHERMSRTLHTADADEAWDVARQRRAFDRAQSGETDNLIASDPPRHTELRRVVSAWFTPKNLARLDDHVRELSVQMLDSIEYGVEYNFVEAVAAEVPVILIAEMLGVPVEDRARFRKWSEAFIAMVGEPVGDDPRDTFGEYVDRMGEFLEYFGDQLERRRDHPSDDILTDIAAAHDVITPAEQLSMARLLLNAGNETTRNLIAGSCRYLAEYPDQKQLLIDDPNLIATAIEELLRLVTPISHQCRTATEDVELGGQEIHAGDYLMLVYSSANRDDSVWENSDVLDVTRPPKPLHLAFGFGEHHCLGAQLARREGRIVLGELLARRPNWHVVGEIERQRNPVVPGYVDIPVVFNAPERSSQT